METLINSIAYEEQFFTWFNAKSKVFTFDFKGLPKKVHFSVGYNEKLDELNLHVTLENGLTPKPKIVIAKIKRAMFESALTEWGINITNLRLRPLDGESLKALRSRKGKKKSGFFCIDKYRQEDPEDHLEKGLREVFQRCSRIKGGNRLKILKTIEEGLLQLFASPESIRYVRSEIAEIPAAGDQQIRSGYLYSPKFNGPVTFIQGKPYVNRDDLTLIDVIEAIMPFDLAFGIYWNALLAINRVKRAKTRNDVLRYEDPIILTFGEK